MRIYELNHDLGGQRFTLAQTQQDRLSSPSVEWNSGVKMSRVSEHEMTGEHKKAPWRDGVKLNKHEYAHVLVNAQLAS